MVTTETPTEQAARTWSAQTLLVVRLGWIASVSVGLNLVLVGVGAWQILHGTPIYYVPAGGPGIALPGVIPESLAIEVASRCLVRRYTFTPSSVKVAHADFLGCLHPSMRAAFQVQATQEAIQVKETKLSTQLVVLGATVARRSAEEVVMRLTGVRTVWFGGRQLMEEAIEAQMALRPWGTIAGPEGLLVTALGVTPALSFGVN